MNRKRFLEELEVLLGTLPKEERDEAMQYYIDYFDDAGADNEDTVIRELGSPERVAGIIKGVEEQNTEGFFTERGYEKPDDVKNNEIIEMTSIQKTAPDQAEDQYSYEYYQESPNKVVRDIVTSEKKNVNWGKIILWGLIIVIALPVIFSVFSAGFGVVLGIIGVLFGLVVAVAAITFGLFAGAVSILCAGTYYLISNPINGVMLWGIGLVLLAGAFLSLIVAVWFYRRALPSMFKGTVDFVKRLFKKGGQKA